MTQIALPRLLDSAAQNEIVPVGSDLRVVARVRTVMPNRNVARLRVAMRVQVTEQDEDVRSLAQAIKRAVRTLAIVALVVAVLAGGASRPQHASAAPASLGEATMGAAPADGVGVPRAPTVETDRRGPALQAGADHQLSSPAALTPAAAVQATPAVPTPRPVEPGAATSWRLVDLAQRTPRPAPAAGVTPSPD